MAEVCCVEVAAERAHCLVSLTVSGDNPFCLCRCFSEGAVHLDDTTWKSLLMFWKVISHHKYNESFPQIPYMCECWMAVERLCSLSFHVDWLLFAISTRLETVKEAEKAGVPKLPICLLSFPEPRQLLVICRRRFSARRVTSTSTRMTCSTSRRNTGKVTEHSHHRI